MGLSRYVAERTLNLLNRYNPHVSRELQENPDRKEEILGILENDIKAIAYGLPADLGDALWEKIEDALGVVLIPPTAGAAAPVIEAAGALVERIILGPAERKYHRTMGKSHPSLSKGLRAYQYLTEIPGLDTILSIIPEKSLAAAGVFIYDIYRITNEAKRYQGDYVKKLYGKHGVIGDDDERYPHPLRPVESPYKT